MSDKIVQDIKTGLKGIRGVGDAVRGNMMAAADQVVGSTDNPHMQASVLKNQAIADKGKRDIQAAQDLLAERNGSAQATQPEAMRPEARGHTNNADGAGNVAGNSATSGKKKGPPYRHPMPLQ